MAHQLCTLQQVGPGTYYPTGFAGPWVVGSWRMSTDPAQSVFAPGFRNALLRSVYVGYSPGGAGPVATLRQHGTGTPFADYLSLRNAHSTYLFGPDGTLIPDGFYLVVATAPCSIQIVYDVE